MIITGMKITNYKKIDFLGLVPDKKMNLISGKNGAGKSSMIEAIIDAIKGKTEMGKKPQRKIKHGKDKAVIEVSIGEGDDALNIKRTITQKDVYLKAERADGKPVSQTDLDRLLDSSTINITKLLHLDPKGQIDFVKKVAGIDTSAVENEYKELYSERTVLNRAAKEAKGAVKSFGDVEKVEPVVLSDILSEIEKVDDSNRKIRRERSAIEVMEGDVATNRVAINKAAATIDHYREAIKVLEEEIETKEKLNAGLENEITKRKNALPEEEDTSALRQQVSDAEEVNAKAKNYEMYKSVCATEREAQKKVDAINSKMEKLLADREEIIKNSKLPFKNVEFDKDLGLIIAGVPFDDMSSAQQIKIMSRIYIESNPELRVIYIKDGSLLDPETLRQIAGMSELKDYQFLVEIVDEVEGSIIMREGRLIDDTTEENE
jgi:DNA repair exonuclease SbcCD ATPase subunit